MFELNDKTAVVTGGGSGIGRAIAVTLAKAGAYVSVWERDADAGAETRQMIVDAGGGGEVMACDVTDLSGVTRAAEALRGSRGRIDILINNAGVGHVGDLAATEAEDFDRLYQINVKGVYHCLKAVVPAMAESKGGGGGGGRGGVVVNLASIASLIGVKDRFAYSMTKGAVLTMTYSVAIDYAQRGVRCNCICPARVHTPFVDAFLAKNYPGRESEMMQTLSEYQPLGRMAEPEEVAAMTLYLCSDEASFLTGNAYPLGRRGRQRPITHFSNRNYAGMKIIRFGPVGTGEGRPRRRRRSAA